MQNIYVYYCDNIMRIDLFLLDFLCSLIYPNMLTKMCT